MGGPSGGPAGDCGVFMGVLAVAVGTLVGVGVTPSEDRPLASWIAAVAVGMLVGVGAGSASQANAAIVVANIAVNSIKSFKRLIESPFRNEMCASRPKSTES